MGEMYFIICSTSQNFFSRFQVIKEPEEEETEQVDDPVGEKEKENAKNENAKSESSKSESIVNTQKKEYEDDDAG